MKDLILHAATINLGYAKLLVADVPDAQLASQPVTGKAMNHPAWVVGHIARSLDVVSKLIDSPADKPVDFKEVVARPGVTPSEWAELYGMKSQPMTDRSRYPAKDVLLKALEDATAKASEVFRRATPAQLDRALGEPMNKRFPTIGHFVVFILTSHSSTHLGQLSAWRRAGGLPSVL